jgi:hypothetical protein
MKATSRSTIKLVNKFRGTTTGYGRGKNLQGSISGCGCLLFSTTRKGGFSLSASEQDQSDLLKWENMYRQGRYE